MVPFLFFTEFRMKRRIEKDEKVYSSSAEFKDRIPLLHSWPITPLRPALNFAKGRKSKRRKKGRRYKKKKDNEIECKWGTAEDEGRDVEREGRPDTPGGVGGHGAPSRRARVREGRLGSRMREGEGSCGPVVLWSCGGRLKRCLVGRLYVFISRLSYRTLGRQ